MLLSNVHVQPHSEKKNACHPSQALGVPKNWLNWQAVQALQFAPPAILSKVSKAQNDTPWHHSSGSFSVGGKPRDFSRHKGNNHFFIPRQRLDTKDSSGFCWTNIYNLFKKIQSTTSRLLSPFSYGLFLGPVGRLPFVSCQLFVMLNDHPTRCGGCSEQLSAMKVAFSRTQRWACAT